MTTPTPKEDEPLKEQLFDLVDKHFPKGKCEERGAAMVLVAEALMAAAAAQEQAVAEVERKFAKLVASKFEREVIENVLKILRAVTPARPEDLTLAEWYKVSDALNNAITVCEVQVPTLAPQDRGEG